MTYEFKFPDIGEGITEGEIVEWLVKEGDEVKEHQTIGKIETDKAIAEIPSPVAGTIFKLNFKTCDTIKVGEVLAIIGEKGEGVQEKIKPQIFGKPEEKQPIIKPAGAVGYLE